MKTSNSLECSCSCNFGDFKESCYYHSHFLIHIRDGPLENLWRVGGEVQKKFSRKAKINGKKWCTPINLKKYSCYSLIKIINGNLITKKGSCGSKIPYPPPPPITFLMVRLYNRIESRHENIPGPGWSSWVSRFSSQAVFKVTWIPNSEDSGKTSSN